MPDTRVWVWSRHKCRCFESLHRIQSPALRDDMRRAQGASPGLASKPPFESRPAGRHDSRRSALLRIPGRLNLCVSVDNGVNSTWRIPLTTVFQQLIAVSWGKLLCSPLASRSATVFSHSAIVSIPRHQQRFNRFGSGRKLTKSGVIFLSTTHHQYGSPIAVSRHPGSRNRAR